MVTGASMTAEELSAASGLSAEEVAGLVAFGLIEPVGPWPASRRYDEDALTRGQPGGLVPGLRDRTPAPAPVPQRGRP